MATQLDPVLADQSPPASPVREVMPEAPPTTPIQMASVKKQTPKWAEVASRPEFQELSSAEQEDVRKSYFDEVVAPQVGSDDLDTARQLFNEDTGASTLGRVAHDAKRTLDVAADVAGPVIDRGLSAVGRGVKQAGETLANPPPVQRLSPPAKLAQRGVGGAGQYDPFIEEAAKTYQVPAADLRAMLNVESSGNPNATSTKGAQGLMQLMPSTAAEMGVTDPSDPRQNILGGARYYRKMLDHYKGNRELAIAAYNAGPGTVDKAGGVPNITETRNHVAKVMGRAAADQGMNTGLSSMPDYSGFQMTPPKRRPGSADWPSNVAITGSARKHGLDRQDPALVEGILGAAEASGLRVEIMSTGRNPGDKGNHSKGYAIDVQLYGPNGEKYDNYQGGGKHARIYEDFFQKAVAWGSQYDPTLTRRARWGGHFLGGSNPADYMHIDVTPGGGHAGGDLTHGANQAMLKTWGGTTQGIPNGDWNAYGQQVFGQRWKGQQQGRTAWNNAQNQTMPQELYGLALKPGYVDTVRAKYDAASPAERAAMISGNDVESRVARFVDDGYRQATAVTDLNSALAGFGTRREDRANSYLSQGFDRKTANDLAHEDLLLGRDTRRLQEPERPSLFDQVTRDWTRGMLNLEATGNNLTGQLMDVIGQDEKSVAFLQDANALEKEAEAFKPIIGDFAKVRTDTPKHLVEDSTRRVIEAIAGNLPSFLPTLALGVGGAAVAGKASMAVAERLIAQLGPEAAAKFAEQKIAQAAAAKGFSKIGATAEAIQAQGASRLAQQGVTQAMNKVARDTAIGGAIGAGAGGWAMESGSIYGDIYDETGQRRPGLAAGMGLLAGAVEAVPAMRAAVKLVGPQLAKQLVEEVGSSLASRVGQETAIQMLSEGGEELVQTLIEKGAVRLVDGKPFWTPETIHEALNAAGEGAIFGGALGGATQAVHESRYLDPQSRARAAGEAIQRGEEAPADARQPGTQAALLGAALQSQVDRARKGLNDDAVARDRLDPNRVGQPNQSPAALAARGVTPQPAPIQPRELPAWSAQLPQESGREQAQPVGPGPTGASGSTDRADGGADLLSFAPDYRGQEGGRGEPAAGANDGDASAEGLRGTQPSESEPGRNAGGLSERESGSGGTTRAVKGDIAAGDIDAADVVPAQPTTEKETGANDWKNLSALERENWVAKAGWGTKKGVANAFGKKLAQKPWADIKPEYRARLQVAQKDLDHLFGKTTEADRATEGAKIQAVAGRPGTDAVQPGNARAGKEDAALVRSNPDIPGAGALVGELSQASQSQEPAPGIDAQADVSVGGFDPVAWDKAGADARPAGLQSSPAPQGWDKAITRAWQEWDSGKAVRSRLTKAAGLTGIKLGSPARSITARNWEDLPVNLQRDLAKLYFEPESQDVKTSVSIASGGGAADEPAGSGERAEAVPISSGSPAKETVPGETGPATAQAGLDREGESGSEALNWVEHTTGRGKTIRGIVRKDITVQEAKQIDPHTFRKDGGFFIREKYLQPDHFPDARKMVEEAPDGSAPATVKDSLTVGATPEESSADDNNSLSSEPPVTPEAAPVIPGEEPVTPEADARPSEASETADPAEALAKQAQAVAKSFNPSPGVKGTRAQMRENFIRQYAKDQPEAARAVAQAWQADPDKYAEASGATPDQIRMFARVVNEVAPAVDAKAEASPSGDFVLAPDGTPKFGKITPEIGQAIRREAGEIRLTHGNKKEGLAHIEHRHGEEIRQAGFASAPDFVYGITSAFDEIRKGEAGALLLVKKTDGKLAHNVYVRLKPSSAGVFYVVETGFVRTSAALEKLELLWPRREDRGTDTGNQPSFADTPASTAGAEAASAKSQSSLRENLGQSIGESKPQKRRVSQKAKQTDTAKAERIDDFGEKLEGARKDYASKMQAARDVDIATESLAKSWPEPDYQKMLDNGINSWSVAFLRALRDEIPTKPKNAWKLKGWVDKVQQLRDYAMNIEQADADAIQQLQHEVNIARLFTNIGGRIELYEAVGHSQSLKGVTFKKHDYMLYKGEKNVSKWSIEMPAKATAFSNWPREWVVADTKQEALDQFKEKFASLALGGKRGGQASFIIYRKRNQTGAFIGKKIGREYVDLHHANDVAAAREYMAANQAALEAKLKAYKDTPYERNEENAPRVGDDHRNGSPVTPQVFADTFGFRGVQFGNYVEQDRRQSDLNEAYDALMDMAAVLGVPPKAISLNGRLGLAFGARGKGGVNAAAAHYEPDMVVINLTKGGGPGSLGHEWWHALDNYFAHMGGSVGYMTTGRMVAGVREEMRQAFNRIRQAINNSGLRSRSKQLDKRRTKEYWTTEEEMSARSFESYLIAKLKDQNAANDYLANIISQKRWDEIEGQRDFGDEPSSSYPYPTADELPALRAAYDEFFKTVQTKDTDQGVAMFSRVPELSLKRARVALEAFAKFDELFQTPKSSALSMEGIAREVDPDIRVVETRPGKSWTFIMPDGWEAFVKTASDGKLFVDASRLVSGQSGGYKLYSVLGAFAHNNGKVFKGDPNGVSKMAMIRRTDNMLSSALKYGTTRHLEPHPDQRIDWADGDEVGNLERLIERAYLNATTGNKLANYNAIPELDDITFNFDTGRFERISDGSEVTDADFNDIAEKHAALRPPFNIRKGDKPAVAGRATVKRAAWLASLLRESGIKVPDGRGRGVREGLLVRHGGKPEGGLNTRNLRGILYSRQNSASVISALASGPANSGIELGNWQPSADQAAVERLNRAMARNFQDPSWSNAYVRTDLPESLAEFAEAAEAAFGSEIIGITATDGRFDQFNGINLGGRNFINLNADVGFVNITGHELLHQLKRDRPDLYRWFAGQARGHYKNFSTYQSKLNALLSPGEKPMSLAAVEEELLGDFAGDALADPAFVERLAKADPGRFRQLLKAVIDWLRQVGDKLSGKGLGSSEYFTDVETLRTYLADALVAYGQGGAVAIRKVEKPKFSRKAPETKLKDFVRRVLNNKADNKWFMEFGIVSEAARSRIKNDVGVDVRNAKEILMASAVAHQQKGHPAMSVDDWDMLASMVSDYDSVHISRYKGQGEFRLIFVKSAGSNGFAHVAEFHSGGSWGDRLSVVSFFKDNPDAINHWLKSHRLERPSAGDAPSMSEPHGEKESPLQADDGTVIQLNADDNAPLFSRRSDLNNYPDEREGSGIEEDPEARFDEDPEALFADIDDAIRKGGGWNEARGELEKRWNKLNASARRQWLGALTVHQLVELGGKVLPRMERYLKEMTGMDVTRNAVLHEVDAIAKDWEKLDKQTLGRLAHVMHESTLAGVDGAEDYVPSIDKKDAIKQIGILKRRMLSVPGDDKWPMLAEIRTLKKQLRFEERRKQAYDGIQRMFQALPEDAKDVYVRSRDYHVAQSKRVEQALVEMIEKTQMSGKQRAAAVQKLRTEFEAQRVNAPYFPLSRKGDYWVYTAPPKNSESKAGAEFHMFQTLEEQTAFIQESQAAGMEILGRGKQLENLQETIGVPGSFVAQVEDIIGQLGEGHPLVESVRDQVYQLYLQTLPDLSARKHFIHRKKTPGFGRDALRAFATKGYHDAYQYARVKHGFEMRSIMEKLREDLDVAGSKPKMKALKAKRDLLEEFRDEVLNAGMGYQAVKERAEGLGIQEMETRAQAGKRRLGEGEQFVADEAKKWNQFLAWMDEWKRYGGIPDRVNQEIADIDLRIRTSRLINTRERGYEFGADVYNELQAAYAWLMNPKTAPWATAMNQMGYLYNLAFSPSAWATNATQNPLVAMPYVAAKHGVKNTTAAFTQAYQEAFRGALSKSANKEHALGIRESLSKPDEIQAYDWALEAGLIERGRAMDLAGTAEEGQDRSAWHRKFSMAMTVGFHDVERLNRETSFVAAYRLARKAGQDFAGAVDYAGEVVNKTHLVYASENRPRFMRSDVARVLLQFKLYSQGISYLLGKSVVDAVGKNASAEEKAEAKRFLAFQFGMQAAAAGALGLPIGLAWWAAQAAFAALFDDDDDPKELEPEFRKALAEALGTTGGEAVAKGLVNALLPVDLHSRIGMRELWFRENDREAEGKDAASRMMSNLMGPMAGIMENLFVGSQLVGEGHVYRGIEKMMPKFIRDPLKALRYESEGVQTLKGDPLIDDLSTGEFLGQLLGFSPSRLNERYDENNAEKNRQERIEERRQKLTGDLAQSRIDGALAQREGDDRKLSKAQSLFEEAMANAQRFNEKQPGFAIGGKTVGRSIQSRVRARAMAKDGIFLNRKIPERYDYATPAEDAE